MDPSKSLSDALSSIRSISTACFALFAVFFVALPTLQETSSEERIIPDLVAWSALENILPHLAARLPQSASVTVGFPGVKIGKDAEGRLCPEVWLRNGAEISSKLSKGLHCPFAILGFYIPGRSGDQLLLYRAQNADGYLVEELLYPYFFSFEVLPGSFITTLPADHYSIARIRRDSSNARAPEFILLPKADGEALTTIKLGERPPFMPYAGPFNSLDVQQTLWRAGKAHLAQGPRTDPSKYFQELNEWLAGRIRNPPRVTAFGIGMDPTLASSIFGILLGLIGFSIFGPYLVLRDFRTQSTQTNWTMAMRTASPGLMPIFVETVALLLSVVFTLGPILVVGSELYYRILKLSPISELLITIANVAAASVASLAFLAVSVELRRRRRS